MGKVGKCLEDGISDDWGGLDNLVVLDESLLELDGLDDIAFAATHAAVPERHAPVLSFVEVYVALFVVGKSLSLVLSHRDLQQ